MSKAGFFARTWRIWEDPDIAGHYHLMRGESEIIFTGTEFSILIELIIRMDNADFIESAQVHSTEED